MASSSSDPAYLPSPMREESASTDNTEMARPGGDDLPFVFSGTLAVRGTGIALARATGIETELGKIGKSLRDVEQEPTLLQRDTRRMVRVLSLAGLALCALLVVFYGLTRGDWLRGFLASLTLAMAILPEELPVVLTVFLALGAWRMSRNLVLTRHMPAIEMLGAATALCVDKTGTLTLNQMSVTRLYAQGEAYDFSKQPISAVPEQFHELAEFAMLASQPDPFDPMDRAIRKLGNEALQSTEHLHATWKVAREYPLSKSLLAISQVWVSPETVVARIWSGATRIAFAAAILSARQSIRHSFIRKPTVPRFIPNTGLGSPASSMRWSVWSMKPSPPSATSVSASRSDANV